jgi:hypothetical protein
VIAELTPEHRDSFLNELSAWLPASIRWLISLLRGINMNKYLADIALLAFEGRGGFLANVMSLGHLYIGVYK